MVESLQMFLFLFKSKYRRKYSWFSPFLCSVIIVLLFCQSVASLCSDHNCVNGMCNNATCVCFEGWQGPECQYCGGKVRLTSPTGIITDGPGNYSVSVQCSWLIEPEPSGGTPPPIRVRLESFATECGWDHLYVYDGDSVRAEKLLAVFSGVLQDGESAWTRQVVARSGRALLHFFSDDAFAMEGFNVTYAAYSCPSNDHYTNCSDHGLCEDGTCRCEPGWIGVACDQPLCPNDCNSIYNAGTCTASGCECSGARAGPDCGRDAGAAGWAWLWQEAGEGPPRAGAGPPPPAVAGHVLLAYGADELLRVGGEMFQDAEFLYKYNVRTRRWAAVETRGAAPTPRLLHSAVLYEHELIVYGGVAANNEGPGGLAGLEGRAGTVSNEVWRLRLDAARPQWRNATPACPGPGAGPGAGPGPAHRPAPRACGGLHVSGHTAVVVRAGEARKPVMLVFFGHSPLYGYLHIVQEYHIEDNVWTVVATRGWPARGGFGHTAAYDPLSGKVFIHGGLLSESEATQAPSAAMHEYDVEERVFKPLPAAPTPRYLHTATFISPGVMLVFGGNAHNDSAAAAIVNPAASGRCYSGVAMIYDVRCKGWHATGGPVGAARAAAAAAALPMASRERRAIVLHGGFDGRLRSDALLFEVGAACASLSTERDCVRATRTAARACAWRRDERLCVPLEDVGWIGAFNRSISSCEEEPVKDEARCLLAETCASCTAAGCSWCGACMASAEYCPRHRYHLAESIEECGASTETAREACGRFHSCAACHAHRATHMHATEDLGPRVCYWDYDTIKCKPANTTEDLRSVAAAGPCPAPCATLQSCANCTAEECIWCASAARCVDKNAYGASFPLGGCRAWSTAGGAAGCGARAGCAAHASCAACRAEPACGWCDDGAGGGRGACVPGGAARPHPPAECPRHRWHFTACPACQCNGHSYCDSHARCVQPCSGRAVGAHCELCAPAHWGSPLNGAHCTTCECNAQAVSCAADTGRCYCSTKGLAGERCDKCDNTNHYHADPFNKGACYYYLAVDYQFTFNLSKKDRHISAINFCNHDLAVDYQFTFNLSKKEDRHLSAINFRNSPVKADVDADFSITCSAHARMNLTVRMRGEPAERTLFAHLNCTNFRYKFAKSEHAFGVEDNVTLTTFFVYVYDFKPPLWIQISFSQYPKLNLQQFFITFSSCFLLLLLVAAALWKIKQKYDMYRRRQRLFVEMEQMASRPFSQVCVELERGISASGVPAPVALEPCRGARAAVLSLLVRLPTGGTGRAPPLGGLAVASALVTLGQHQAPPGQAKRPRPH